LHLLLLELLGDARSKIIAAIDGSTTSVSATGEPTIADAIIAAAHAILFTMMYF